MEPKSKTNKGRASGLYTLALERIRKCQKVKGQIVSFPQIFESLCRAFSIKKQEAWEILFILREFGMIRIVPYKGVIVQ